MLDQKAVLELYIWARLANCWSNIFHFSFFFYFIVSNTSFVLAFSPPDIKAIAITAYNRSASRSSYSGSIVSLGQVHQNDVSTIRIASFTRWLSIATWTYLKENLKLLIVYRRSTDNQFPKRYLVLQSVCAKAERLCNKVSSILPLGQAA